MSTTTINETRTTTDKLTYSVVEGGELGAVGSGAFGDEFVIRVYRNGTFSGFMKNAKGAIRLFTTRSGARKAITREKRGDYHR